MICFCKCFFLVFAFLEVVGDWRFDKTVILVPFDGSFVYVLVYSKDSKHPFLLL